MTKLYCPHCGSKIKKIKQHCPFCGEKLPEIKKDPSKIYTDITIILDRSGSMKTILEATISGFNDFLESQRKVKGKATISLYQFDDRHETVYENIDIQEAPELDTNTFVPRGSTALLDAIWKWVILRQEHLAKFEKKPDKIIIVIITDGRENNSKEITNTETIKELIKEKETVGWEFVYIGANQDAIAVAETFGIARQSAITYSAKPTTTKAVFGELGAMFKTARGSPTQKFAFVEESRSKVVDDYDADYLKTYKTITKKIVETKNSSD